MVPSNSREQIRRDEGEILYVYLDSLGFQTLGNGRLVDRRKGGGITPDESAYLLTNDLTRVDREIDLKVPWWRKLDAVRQGVLRNMTFQLGIDGLLEFKHTLMLIFKGDYLAASVAMLESDWAGQTPVRAHRLAEQMKTGNWQ